MDTRYPATHPQVRWTSTLAALLLIGLPACKDQDKPPNPHGGDVTDSTTEPTEPSTGGTTSGSTTEPSTTDTGSTTPVPQAAEYPGFRRLSKEQYVNTFADLFDPYTEDFLTYSGETYSFDIEEDVWPPLRENELLNLIPDDVQTGDLSDVRGGFRRLDQVVQQEHVDGWFGLSMSYASGIFDCWLWGQQVVFGRCDAAYNAGNSEWSSEGEARDSCMADFIDDIGPRAMRRPLTDEDRTLLWESYEAGKDSGEICGSNSTAESMGFRYVLGVILNTPHFLYHIEEGDEEGDLTAYELASRLSYHFWNTMPDEELFAAAADGSLLTDEGYAAQVERLYADERTRTSLTEFFEDYFRVQHFPDIYSIAAGTDGWEAYHGVDWSDYGNNANYSDIAMTGEVTNLGLWYAHTRPGTFNEMFYSNLNFMQPIELSWKTMDVWSEFTYGAPSWDGVSEPEPFPESTRVGLLTRMPLLAASTIIARPVQRGLFIREALICERPYPPEDASVVVVPEVDTSMNTREVLEAMTEQEGSTCISCHGTYFNGLGYATGHFSSTGRYQEQEPMFSETTYYTMGQPSDIDTTGQSWIGGEMATFSGVEELAAILADSGAMETCFARQYFRYAMGRMDSEADEAFIEELGGLLFDGMPIDEGLRAMAMSETFRSSARPTKEDQP